MTAQIIDGKAFAAGLRQQIAKEVATLAPAGVVPGLAVILVGEDPASEVYVRNKGKAAEECGIYSLTEVMPATTTQAQLLAKVEQFNRDPKIHGILVQLPLPQGLDAEAVINAIDPDKDVDGFHVVNAGRLATGQESLVPCTPQGCLMLLQDAVSRQSSVASKSTLEELATTSDQVGAQPARRQEPKALSANNLSGLHAVVIGRSNIVGKPMAQLLLGEGCTVTICHSKTKDLPAQLKQADIVVAAVGRPEMVVGEWLKPGAVVIDVGINRINTPDGKTKLVGDVHFESAAKVVGAITPVPGGVGPMTIACLLNNTLKAVKRSLR